MSFSCPVGGAKLGWMANACCSLAWAEMYIAIAMIMRRFDLELYDVVRERDVNHYRDCFLGEPRDDSRGVRVVVKGLLD